MSLLEYQKPHMQKLINAYLNNQCILDASDTGTGKTYTTCYLAKIMNLKLFVICPKSIINTWKNVSNIFDVKYYGITNYELLQYCKYYTQESGNKRIKGTYISKNNNNIIKYKWNLPSDTLLVFDEAHRCKNEKTVNSHILMAASQISTKILLLSATIADKPEYFKIAGYIMNFYPHPRHFRKWWKNILNENKHTNGLKTVHSKIFPHKGSRMKMEQLGLQFPKNQIKAQCYTMENADKIEKTYRDLENEIKTLKEQEKNAACALVAILRARQKIELYKIPTFVELTKTHLENNLSVVIFVNFTETLMQLADMLNTDCIVYGQQSFDERMKNIEDFIENRENLIICNIRAGGVGIDLNDKYGNHQRISLISPTWSAQDLIQSFGRIYRADNKTPALQRIIFCSDSVEEMICQNVDAKLENYASINNGDLDSYDIEKLTDFVSDKTLTI